MQQKAFKVFLFVFLLLGAATSPMSVQAITVESIIQDRSSIKFCNKKSMRASTKAARAY
jgi:hypothetical protein